MTLAAWVKCENTGEHHAIFDARTGAGTWITHPELRSNGQFRWVLRAYGMSPIFDIRGGSVTWGQYRWRNAAPRFGSFQEEIDHLKDWLARRTAWIDAQFVSPPIFTPEQGFK
ncbi:MAG: hypothetical protein ABIL62_13295 [Planctomycetota bacterium]